MVAKQRGSSDAVLEDAWLQLTSITWDHNRVSQTTANHGSQKDIRCLDTFLKATCTSA